ncbi:MAG TPA: hypothetical protein VGB37_14620 [Candidatus Lokiarchaeia archaeon]
MPNNSWVDLEKLCPIDISRIISYSNSFNTNLPQNFSDIDKSKAKLLDARGDFDLMITTLVQLLHDYDTLQKLTDTKLFNELKGDLGRYLKTLDEKENYYLIEEDSSDKMRNRVYVSRLGAYAKLLRTSASSIIYETLLKSTDEYNKIKPEDNIKKEKRTFLYILFQVLQVTLSVLGAYTRDKSPSSQKIFNDYAGSNYKNMLSDKGQEMITESIKDEIKEDKYKKLETLFDDFEDTK